MPRRFILLFAVFIIVLAAGLSAALYFMRQPSGSTSWGTALVGGPFSLVDQAGARVTEKDFRGKYMLVFFGYTYCPDVCPTELQVMMAAVESLGTEGNKIQPIFITVDPERDSPAVMKAYVENFGPRLLGLTGSPAEIAAVAKAYRVYFGKAGKAAAEDYLMDHSSIIYLMGPDGKFLKHFTYTTDAPKLAQALKEAITNAY
jgi:cytochrome oxidase Cu insertion factor (SCO1/SenC/PrrC family)